MRSDGRDGDDIGPTQVGSMTAPPPLSRRSFLARGLSTGAVTLATLAIARSASDPLALLGARQASATVADPGTAPVYNVRDYGAVGNGVTDDTAAIQAAIQAATKAGGGIAYLPTGIYAVTGISLAPSVDLIGASRNSAVLLFTPTSGDAITVTQLGMNRVWSLQVRFAHPVSSGAAIHLIKAFAIDVSEIYVNGLGEKGYDGIFIDQSTATFVRNFNLYGLTNAAVHIAGPFGNDAYLSSGIINLFQTDSGASLLVENFVNGAVNVTDADLLLGRYALLVRNSNYMRFENAYFDSSAEGAVLESGNLHTFSNCWFSNRPGSGLTIGAVRGVTVLGGQAVNCGANGILVTNGAHEVSISGVQVIGNNVGTVGADGIRVDGSGIDNFAITHCLVGNDATAAILQTTGQEVGIHVSSAVRDSHYVITGNLLFDNRVMGLVDRGGGEKYVVGNISPGPPRSSQPSPAPARSQAAPAAAPPGIAGPYSPVVPWPAAGIRM